MVAPIFGLLSAAAPYLPYIGNLLGINSAQAEPSQGSPSQFTSALNGQLAAADPKGQGYDAANPMGSDAGQAAMRARQSFLAAPPAVSTNYLDPSQGGWVNPDTGISASQKNLNTPPPVPSYEDFLKQYHKQALWSAIGKGPGQAIGAIFGGVDADAPAEYAKLQKSAQEAETGRLGLTTPTIVNEILSGKRDPNSGALLAPPQASAPPAAAMPQDAAPQGMPPAPAMPAPQGIPGQPGPLLAPPGASAAFPPGAPPPQAPPQGGGVLSVPPGMTPIQAIIMRAMDPVRYKAIVDGQNAPIRSGYGPMDASGNRQVFAPPEAGNPFPATDPRWPQYQAMLDSQKANITQGARAAADKNVKGFQNFLEFGDLGLGGQSGGTGQPGGVGSTHGPIPIASQQPPAAAANQPIKTPQGTLSPTLAEQPPIPRDETSLKAALPDWQKKGAEITSMPMAVQEPLQRLQTIAEMFKLTESGQWATTKAQIGAMAKTLEIPLPTNWTGDVTAVQTALHENAVKTLQTLKATTSRFTQLEFKTLSGNTEHPDLQPGANLQQLSEDIGTLQQQSALGKDWSTVGRMSGWRDPQSYEAAWSTHNPLSKFVAEARDKIGPLKGMPDAVPPSATHVWTPDAGIVPVPKGGH